MGTIWIVLWVSGAAAAALGLLVSSWADTYRVALMAVPVLMIPQLLFGGALRSIADAQQETKDGGTVSRWS